MLENLANANFAANLRRICNEATSIADVCRDTGINRQQFNKYLAGRTVPGTKTLRKICDRLGVTEAELFAPPQVPKPKFLGINERTIRLGREMDRLIHLIMPHALHKVRADDRALPVGRYQCYFSFPGNDNLLLRSYVEIWQQNDALCFARLTRNKLARGGGAAATFRGRHYGLVVATEAEVSLVGINRVSPHQMSLMNMEPERYQGRFWLGLGITRTLKGPVSCRTALELKPAQASRRELLRQSGILPLNDPSVPSLVRGALAAGPQNHTAITLPTEDQIDAALALDSR